MQGSIFFISIVKSIKLFWIREHWHEKCQIRFFLLIDGHARCSNLEIWINETNHIRDICLVPHLLLWIYLLFQAPPPPSFERDSLAKKIGRRTQFLIFRSNWVDSFVLIYEWPSKTVALLKRKWSSLKQTAKKIMFNVSLEFSLLHIPILGFL